MLLILYLIVTDSNWLVTILKAKDNTVVDQVNKFDHHVVLPNLLVWANYYALETLYFLV